MVQGCSHHRAPWRGTLCVPWAVAGGKAWTPLVKKGACKVKPTHVFHRYGGKSNGCEAHSHRSNPDPVLVLPSGTPSGGTSLSLQKKSPQVSLRSFHHVPGFPNSCAFSPKKEEAGRWAASFILDFFLNGALNATK